MKKKACNKSGDECNIEEKTNISCRYIFIFGIHKINIVIQKLFKHKTNQDIEPMELRERTINNLLVLHLINETNKKGTLENNFKVQKMVFSIQKLLTQRHRKAFSYNFFRWQKGPFSAHLNNDLSLLQKNKMVDWGKDKIVLTQQGTELLNACREIIDKNVFFHDTFNEIVDEYAKLPPEEIKSRIYQLRIFVPILRKVMPIKDIPLKQLILFKPRNERMKYVFDIDESWEATLDILFDKDAIVSLSMAFKDAKEGRHGEPFTVHTS